MLFYSIPLVFDDADALELLKLWKGCVNTFNYSRHSQYKECLLLKALTQPFHSINGLLIRALATIYSIGLSLTKISGSLVTIAVKKKQGAQASIAEEEEVD